MRGGAKALDIWRMETKLEVLFEEVLNIIKVLKVERRPSTSASAPLGHPCCTGSDAVVATKSIVQASVEVQSLRSMA